MAEYMHFEVPGVTIPEKLMKRMKAAGDKAEEEGVQIALELIEAVKGKQGVNGIHLMAVGWEEIVPRILKESGLAPKTESAPEAASAAPEKAAAP
jgi:5,10-methylenetetrahydrofolate reductase